LLVVLLVVGNAWQADAEPAQVRELCAEAAQYSFCSVCVNSSYASFARQVRV